MNKPAVVFAAVVLLAATSRAQVGIGLTGGVNLATAGGADRFPGTKNLTAYAAGAYLDIDVPFLLSVQPEILYSVKGYTTELSYPSLGIPTTTKGTVKLNYLEVPVLFKYSLPVPLLKPNVFVGPSVGILLSAHGTIETTGQPTQESDLKSSYKSTDWGAVFGAGASVFAINLNVRYTLGLTKLVSSGQFKTYNRVWSVMIEVPL